MTILYSDKISQYMLQHACSRGAAKRAMRGVLKRERDRNDVPTRGAPVAGTGKPKGATK